MSVQADKPAPQLEKKCLYVQRYMNTVITLLADEGLNQEQDVLHSLVSHWRALSRTAVCNVVEERKVDSQLRDCSPASSSGEAVWAGGYS